MKLIEILNKRTPIFILNAENRDPGMTLYSCQKAGFQSTEIFEGIVPKYIGKLPDYFQGRWKRDLSNKWGTICCTLSHIKMAYHAIADRCEGMNVLFLEDDVTVSEDIFDQASKVNISGDDDLIFLDNWNQDHRHLINFTIGHIKITNSQFNGQGICFGAYAYMITNLSNKHPLIRSYNLIKEPIDEHMMSMIGHGFVKASLIKRKGGERLVIPDLKSESLRKRFDIKPN